MEPTFNLTEAVREEECIDFGELEGRLARVIDEELGTHIQFKMVRDEDYPPNTPSGWDIVDGEGGFLISFTLLERAWKGEDGWRLEVAGEKPFKHIDLKSLEPGTWFKDSEGDIGVIICSVWGAGQKMVYWPANDRAWMHRASDFKTVTAVAVYDEMPIELLKKEMEK